MRLNDKARRQTSNLRNRYSWNILNKNNSCSRKLSKHDCSWRRSKECAKVIVKSFILVSVQSKPRSRWASSRTSRRHRTPSTHSRPSSSQHLLRPLHLTLRTHNRITRVSLLLTPTHRLRINTMVGSRYLSLPQAYHCKSNLSMTTVVLCRDALRRVAAVWPATAPARWSPTSSAASAGFSAMTKRKFPFRETKETLRHQ